MVLDSDVIVRYLTNDDPAKSRRFEKFLESKEKVVVTDVTFAEVYWTLKSFYKFEKNKILDSLEALINTPLIVSNLKILQNTVSFLRGRNVSFVDAYNASYSIIKDDSRIMSFDKGFDKIPELNRLEP